MTVQELIEALQDYDGDTQVMVAHQPSWPLRETVSGVCHASELPGPEDEEDPAEVAEHVEDVLYIAANGHPNEGSPYAPRDVWDCAR